MTPFVEHKCASKIRVSKKLCLCDHRNPMFGNSTNNDAGISSQLETVSANNMKRSLAQAKLDGAACFLPVLHHEMTAFILI